jgi:hypothetical protein
MLLPTRRRSVTGLAQHVPAPFAPSKLPMSPSCARRTDGDNETGDSGDRRGRPTPATIAGTHAAGSTCSSFAPQWASAIDGGGAVSVLAGVHVGCFERGRDHPDGRPDGQRCSSGESANFRSLGDRRYASRAQLRRSAKAQADPVRSFRTEAKSLGGVEIYNQLEGRRLLDR